MKGVGALGDGPRRCESQVKQEFKGKGRRAGEHFGSMKFIALLQLDSSLYLQVSCIISVPEKAKHRDFSPWLALGISGSGINTPVRQKPSAPGGASTSRSSIEGVEQPAKPSRRIEQMIPPRGLSKPLHLEADRGGTDLSPGDLRALAGPGRAWCFCPLAWIA